MTATIERGFLQTDRYRYDFGPCSLAKGWAQIDTAQDASYFGQWTNPESRQVYSYIEGDQTLTTYETDAEYAEGLRELAAWTNDRGHGPCLIDAGGADCIVHQHLVAMGLSDLMHITAGERP